MILLCPSKQGVVFVISEFSPACTGRLRKTFGRRQQFLNGDSQHLAEAAQRTQRDVRASPFDAQQPHGAYTAARGQRLHRKALSAA